MTELRRLSEILQSTDPYFGTDKRDIGHLKIHPMAGGTGAGEKFTIRMLKDVPMNMLYGLTKGREYVVTGIKTPKGYTNYHFRCNGVANGTMTKDQFDKLKGTYEIVAPEVKTQKKTTASAKSKPAETPVTQDQKIRVLSRQGWNPSFVEDGEMVMENPAHAFFKVIRTDGTTYNIRKSEMMRSLKETNLFMKNNGLMAYDNIMEQEPHYIVHPNNILHKALNSHFITVEEAADPKVQQAAQNIAQQWTEDWQEGQGFSSSDMTALLKEFLNDIGKQTEFVNNKLTIVQPMEPNIKENMGTANQYNIGTKCTYYVESKKESIPVTVISEPQEHNGKQYVTIKADNGSLKTQVYTDKLQPASQTQMPTQPANTSGNYQTVQEMPTDNALFKTKSMWKQLTEQYGQTFTFDIVGEDGMRFAHSVVAVDEQDAYTQVKQDYPDAASIRIQPSHQPNRGHVHDDEDDPNAELYENETDNGLYNSGTSDGMPVYSSTDKKMAPVMEIDGDSTIGGTLSGKRIQTGRNNQNYASKYDAADHQDAVNAHQRERDRTKTNYPDLSGHHQKMMDFHTKGIQECSTPKKKKYKMTEAQKNMIDELRLLQESIARIGNNKKLLY